AGFRAWLSLPARPRRVVARPAARDAAHARCRRFGGDRWRADRHLSARIAGWLAPHRAHAARAFGFGPRTAVPPGAGCLLAPGDRVRFRAIEADEFARRAERDA